MTVDSSALIWRALADSSRRQILDLLREQPMTTGELSTSFRMISRYAVMKHLKILVASGLVVVRRRGRERWNYLNVVPLQRIIHRWVVSYESLWATGFIRLAQQLEKEQQMTSREDKQVTSIHIAQDIEIEAPPEKVFQALVEKTDSWWGLPYLRNSQARQLVLQARLGGMMYEIWGEEGAEEGAECARVITYKKNEVLELSGRFGLEGAGQSVALFELVKRSNGTLLQFTHNILGEVSEETRRMYTYGWKDLLGVRLKAFVETGICHGIGHAQPSFSAED